MNFSFLIPFLLLFSISLNAANYSCDGETITNIDGTSIDASQTFSENSSAAQGHSRYFQFNTNINGTINFSIEKNGVKQLIYVGTSCGNNDIYDDSDDSSNQNGSFSVTAGVDYYIMVEEKNSGQELNFNLSFDFIADSLNFTCANPKEYEKVYSANGYQKILLIGNSSMCEDDGSGGCSDPGNARNNNINMINFDADSDPATTINSSAALLSMPNNKEVMWAGLFWQGYLVNENDTVKESARHVKFKHESGSYANITADDYNWVYFDSSRMYYQGFKEVTNTVNSYKDGYYWLGDIVTEEGKPTGGSFGAWSLVVVYQDDSEHFKNATIFHGYEAVSTSGDETGAENYANANGCSTYTGVLNTVTSTLDGFLTPKDGTVESTLFMFAGEGDKGATGDSGTITDGDGNEYDLTDTINPANDIMNATISFDGSHVTTGIPHDSNNSLGIDIDSYDLDGKLSNEQTSTDITLTTSGDGYMPGMYALETELFVPELCYDYAYNQGDYFFTESNDGSKDPYLKGTVTTGTPVTVGLYIRNRVASDINVTDLRMDVYDFNTSNIIYERDTTYYTPVNSIIQELSPDNDPGRSVSDSYTKGVYIGDLGANDFFYLYYNVNPLKSSLNEQLHVKATYNLTVGGSTMLYETVFGQNIDLCTDNNFRYKPAKSIFSVVHQDFYDYDQDPTSSNRYYNLPTQVVNREGNFKVVAFDPDDLDTPKNVSTMVAVDMIRLDYFHDSNTSCDATSTSISDKVWITFNNTNSASFNKTALQNAIINGTTDLTDSKDFYKEARSNVTFRVNYNTTRDGNEDLIQLEEGTGSDAGKYKFLNFTELVQDIGTCANGRQVVNPQTGNTSSQVSVLCGNAGNYNTLAQVRACQECVFGYSTRFICARDNFSIRPESFDIAMYDQNTTDPTGPKSLLSNSSAINLASGHNYFVEINATTHTDDGPAIGYDNMIDSEFTSSHLGYSWAPLTSDIVTGCNDTNNSFESKQFISGSLDFNSSLEQVGRYKFNILDTTWTKVDTDPYQMDFHVSPYYIPASTPDCTPNSSAVSSNNPYSGIKNGCNISSSHTNVDTGATYRDYNITFHPYEFDISSISLTKNPLDVNVSNNDFVYMQDLAQNDNMSLHLNGNIRAVSETNTTLSNFVDSCFAKPLTITVDTSDTNHTVPYQYNFIVLDNSRTVDANITGVSTGFSLNTLTSDFVKASNGSTSTVLNMNYFRSKSNAVNPKRVTYNSYDVNCTVPSNCAFSANLNNMTTSASNNFNLNVSHLYGRTNAPRKVFTGDSGNSFVYFESYCLGCNKALLPNGILSASTNDPRWFVNTFHTASDGVVGDITQKNASNINDVTNPAFGAPTQVTLNYNENAGYPYKATMENNASSWLIFNQYNAADTTNEFEVEFVNSSADWAGVDGANSATENNATTKTNRRIMW